MADCSDYQQDQEGPIDWDPSDFTDDFHLRIRNPYAHGLSFDDEILFLIGSTSMIRQGPFGFLTTGHFVIPRKERDVFRITMLNTFKSADYVKAPLAKFIMLGNIIL